MASTLFILNEAPYGSERAYDALRLAGAMAGRDGQQVPEGCHNVERMLGKLLRHGSVALCGTCMDARGMQQADMVDGASRSNLSELADWVLQADKVIVF